MEKEVPPPDSMTTVQIKPEYAPSESYAASEPPPVSPAFHIQSLIVFAHVLRWFYCVQSNRSESAWFVARRRIINFLLLKFLILTSTHVLIYFYSKHVVNNSHTLSHLIRVCIILQYNRTPAKKLISFSISKVCLVITKEKVRKNRIVLCAILYLINTSLSQRKDIRTYRRLRRQHATSIKLFDSLTYMLIYLRLLRLHLHVEIFA